MIISSNTDDEIGSLEDASADEKVKSSKAMTLPFGPIFRSKSLFRAKSLFTVEECSQKRQSPSSSSSNYEEHQKGRHHR